MSAPDKKIVTRFAPSPTGALHIGGARTALYSWAYARGRGGIFYLRLEDTDQKRSSEALAEAMLHELKWLGLDWDNQGHEPRQSQRLARYDEHVERLLREGRAYEDKGAVRFRMDRDVAIDDAVYGRVEVKAADLEDFVIKKADGFPTFHLAVVVDDADMGVTHVIRGQEHLSNTPKHAALFDAFGYARPVFAHTPSIMNADGSKMSKRDKAKAARAAAIKWLDDHDPQEAADLAQPAGVDLELFNAFVAKQNDDLDIANAIAKHLGVELPEINVADFRDSGYLPGVICNYVTLLGWNPGHDVERYDLAFFREKFDFDRINKSNSRFDRDKLLAFNGEALAKLSPAEFAAALRHHMATHHEDVLFDLENRNVFETFAASYQARSKTLEDPVKQGRFFMIADDAIAYDPEAVKKVLAKSNGEGFAVLRELKDVLAAVDPWSGKAAHDVIVKHAESKGLGMGKVAQPLRVAVCGGTVSPPIDATLDILGHAATLARIERCLSVAS